MGDQEGRTQPKASKGKPRPTPPHQPFFPPRLTEGLKAFPTLEVSFLYKSDLSLPASWLISQNLVAWSR